MHHATSFLRETFSDNEARYSINQCGSAAAQCGKAPPFRRALNYFFHEALPHETGGVASSKL